MDCASGDELCAVSTRASASAYMLLQAPLKGRAAAFSLRGVDPRCLPMKVTTICTPSPELSVSKTAHSESFEEWQARVCALDTAVRHHLASKGEQDWRYIDVPAMLANWRAKRCESSYLNLFERFMRMLEIFAGSGTMSLSVVQGQLCACECFLAAQSPALGREKTLRILAGKARARVAQQLQRNRKAA